MNEAENRRFSRIENSMESQMDSYKKTMSLLKEVKDKKLYREDYATFEEYCSTRFNIPEYLIQDL
jgi:hypothetical protein